MFRLNPLLAALLLCAGPLLAQDSPKPGAAAGGVQITQLTNHLRIEINGKLFTEYFFTNVPRPYYYPVLGPGDLPMTRHWPMETVPDEEQDHPHHRSLWFAHGAVNGCDFWSEVKGAGRIEHVEFLETKSGADSGVIRSRNRWITPEGNIACTDERTLKIYNPGKSNELVFDFEITLKASDGDFTLGDTKEGTMAMRLAETMRLKGKVGQGHIVNSEGVRDGETWGKRAEWCDYYGPVQGRVVGVAMFDHPANPRHPTWWHVRDYGLFAANPFGQHDFEKLPDKNAGNLTVHAGDSVTFRYRFVLHEGDTQQADIAAKYRDYAGPAKKSN